MQRSLVTLKADYPGTRRELHVLRFGTAGARPKAYLQAALHAEELNGTLVLKALMNRLRHLEQASGIAGEIILVPCANPIGLSQQINARHLGRFHLATHANFNRGFPNLGPLVEAAQAAANGRPVGIDTLRSHMIEHLRRLTPPDEWSDNQRQLLGLSVDADLILDLHCDSVSVLHLYQSSPIWPRGSALSADLGAEAILLNRIDPAELSFSEANAHPWLMALERNLIGAGQLPTVATVEMRGFGQVSGASITRDADRLLRYLARIGVVDAPVAAECRLAVEPTPLDAMDVGYAPCGGIILYHREAGERVESGDPVAEVYDPCTDHTETVVAHGAGILFARRPSGSLVQPGSVLFRIAGTQPLSHRRNRASVDD